MPSAERLHVATRKGLFTFEPTGSPPGWRVARRSFLGDHVSAVTEDPRDGRLYAALDHGHFGTKLHASSDGGATWAEIGCPAYPEPPADWDPAPPLHGDPPAWALKKVWTIEPGGADEPGALWCGTLPGGLFRSDDGGASWRLVESLWLDPRRQEWFGGGFDVAGIHSVCVDPRDARRLSVGVSCGGAWHSEDGGATWTLGARGMRAEYVPEGRAGDENVQDPHRLVRCPGAPDRMWTQHHNGVFRSDDGGRTWTEVRPPVSGFGFAVAVHPTDGDTAWLVPAIKDERRIPVDGRLVVTRTRDGGATWDELRTGLPQADAYDLVYRHALEVDASGAGLVMGSTTGNLFASADGGDAWHVVSATLPPVHAVRLVG